jgi:hypothetical protein
MGKNKKDKPGTNRGSMPLPDEALNRGDGREQAKQLNKDEMRTRVTPPENADGDNLTEPPGKDSNRRYNDSH